MGFNKLEARDYLKNRLSELEDIKNNESDYEDLERWWSNISFFCNEHGIRKLSEFNGIRFRKQQYAMGVGLISETDLRDKGIKDAEYLLKNIIDSLSVYQEEASDIQPNIALNINNKNELNNSIDIRGCDPEVKMALESIKDELCKPQPDKFTISKLFGILVDKGMDVLVNIFTGIMLKGE